GQAHLLPIDQRGVAADDAGGLHLLDALPARGAGQPGGGGQLLHGLARIALQFGQQQHVVAVEVCHSANRLVWRMAFSPASCGGPATSSTKPDWASWRPSTRSWARRRCWARSVWRPIPSAPATASSRAGTARARASIAPATRSSTATPTAPRHTAAC